MEHPDYCVKLTVMGNSIGLKRVNFEEADINVFFLFQVVIWVDPLDGTKEYTDGM